MKPQIFGVYPGVLRVGGIFCKRYECCKLMTKTHLIAALLLAYSAGDCLGS